METIPQTGNITTDVVDKCNSNFTELNSTKLAYPNISLPFDFIPVAVGRELNIWKDHLVRNAFEDKSRMPIFIFTNDAESTINNSNGDYYRLTPTAQAVHNLFFNFYDRDIILKSSIEKSTGLKIVSDSEGTGAKQFLFVGDSLMAAETIVTETGALLDSGGGITRTFLGTQGTAPNNHEGHGSKQWNWFNNSESPFWNAALGRVDFTNYMSVNGYTGNIDIAVFQSAINDVGQTSFSNYPMTDEAIATIISDSVAVISQLLTDYPDCKIVFNLEPIGGMQDGAVYSAAHLKMKMLQLFDAYYAEYSKTEYNGNVFINPAYLWVDPIYGYPFETIDRSARYTALQVNRQTDCIHLSQSGYKQNADATYSMIRYILSL